MSEELQIVEKLKYNPLDKAIVVPKHTDKIILPEKILHILVNQQKIHNLNSLPHPLVFRLSTPSNSTYVGVREFHSFAEDTVYLSEDVCHRLNLTNDDTETFMSIELALNVSGFGDPIEKSIIELSPREKYKVHDWKSFLEAILSAKYTAVTTNDVLTFEIDKREYILDVISVKTTNNIRTVCVVDRDVELNIKLPDTTIESLEEDENVGSSDGEYKDLFNDETGEIGINERIKISIRSNQILKSNGEFVLGFDRFVNGDRFEFGTMNKPEKSWVNDSNDTVCIYLYGLGVEVDGLITGIKFEIVSDDEDETENIEDEIMMDADSIRCIYCNNIIKKSSQLLHENFCRRNNIICPDGCGSIFLKTIPKTHWHCCSTYGNGEWSHKLHVNYMHDTLPGLTCELCEEYSCTNRYTLAQHVSNECPNSIHECKYCHLILPRGIESSESKFHGVSSHEWICGAKTTECHKCGKIIKLRELESHVKLHDMVRLSNCIPQVCSNELCVNTITLDDGNPVGLCKDCFGVLYSNVFDPDGKKLIQRIERRYILQIKNGCGSRTCENRLCGNSNKCEVADDIKKSMAAIVKYVKNEIMSGFSLKDCKFQFCVSENIDQRRHIIEMFQNSEWAFGWICKSNEINGNEINQMTQWLENNAVKNVEYK